jgi:transcriptional regulator with XRE-family HTH domain
VIARSLMHARIKAQLWPHELEEAADLEPGTVDQIEDAQRPPTDAEIAALAGALGMPPAGLTGAAA